MRRTMLTVVVAIGTGTAIAVGASTVPAAAQNATGMVTVVHGLRGVVADVYLDGKLVLPAFQPERVTDPIALPAGTHHVEIRVAGHDASAPPDVAGDVNVTAGGRESVVAHLDANGAPTVTTYDEDLTPVPAGQTRTVIRHDAAAPAVDVALNETLVASALADPGSAAATVPPATYQVSVWSPGTRQALAATQPATLSEGTSTVLYLIGSASAGTLSWVAEQISDLATPPTRIQTGDSGLAADAGGRGLPVVPITAISAFAGALVGAGLLLARERRRPAR